MTALTAILDSVLEPSFLIMVGPIAVVAALFIWAEHRADRIQAARAELTAATIAHIGTCGHSNGALVCNRAKDHAGAHADFTKGSGDYGVQWRDGSLGAKSLDDIRREFDLGEPA